MKTAAKIVMVLAGMAGLVANAVAENRGLSPIITPIITIGECHLVNQISEGRGAGQSKSPIYSINPIESVNAYFSIIEKRDVGLEGNATLLEGPKHGEMKQEWQQNYRYTPVENYIGTDQATFLIEIGGLKVKVIYHFNVIDGGAIGGTELFDKKNCPKGMFWKISTTQDTNGSLVVGSAEYQPLVSSTTDTAANNSFASWLTLAQLDGKFADMSGINIAFADLPGSAVGQTVGNIGQIQGYPF